VYEKIRRHNDIRFTVKKIQGTSDKVFLLLQVAVMFTLARVSNDVFEGGFRRFTLE
jgi:hypothetical protein